MCIFIYVYVIARGSVEPFHIWSSTAALHPISTFPDHRFQLDSFWECLPPSLSPAPSRIQMLLPADPSADVASHCLTFGNSLLFGGGIVMHSVFDFSDRKKCTRVHIYILICLYVLPSFLIIP